MSILKKIFYLNHNLRFSGRSGGLGPPAAKAAGTPAQASLLCARQPERR
jgi:hypothetical protein